MTPRTIELPLESFTPFPAAGIPSAHIIRQFQREVYQCAASVPTTLGGGNHGHIGMFMSPADYDNLSTATTTWKDPPIPKLATFTKDTDAHVRDNKKAVYAAAKEAYDLASTLEAKLMKMTQEAIPTMFLNKLSNPLTGFAGVRIRDILAHLQDTYGKINRDDMATIEKQLDAPWDVQLATEVVFDQATECQQFATAALDPISDERVMRALLRKFEQSGVLKDACRDWVKKAPTDQTVDNMRTHFRIYNTERLRTSSPTSGSLGLGGTAHAAQASPPTSDTMSAVVAAEVARVLATRETTAPATRDLSTAGPACAYYCWTHGLTRNANHTSQHCNSPADNHCREATVDNMMGGNNTIQRRRNEQVVFRHRIRQPPAPGSNN